MGVTSRPAPADALRAAQRRFLSAERIDMSAVSEGIGVNRVTLYRWFGSRDRFMVEVMWSLAERTLERVDAEIEEAGAGRIVALAVGFLKAVIANEGMQRWLKDEGEHAMRLMTRHEPGFQPRLIAWIERACREETSAGRLKLPIDLHELAYVVVRMLESYLYMDLITGEQPDAQRAEATLRMLMRVD
jgi:AcrR family transcriptional regulator